jgi:hypothetical protein
MVAGGFISRLQIRGTIITSLRDVGNYSLFPGHKCPGYDHTPLWGITAIRQLSNSTRLPALLSLI